MSAIKQVIYCNTDGSTIADYDERQTRYEHRSILNVHMDVEIRGLNGKKKELTQIFQNTQLDILPL